MQGSKINREKELIKNTIIISIGRLLPKLMSIITLPVLTACLTKTEYGKYDLITSLVALVIPIATLQIQSAAFRFLIDCRGDYKSSSDIISNIFVVTIPVSMMASLIIQFFFSDLSPIIRILIFLYFFLDTLYLTVAQTARGLGKNMVYSVASVIVSVTTMLTVVVFIYLFRTGLFGVMLALVLSHAFSTIYIIERTRLFSYLSVKKVSLKKIKELLLYSWPMVPNNLSTWVLKLSDRLVIIAYLGIEANAVYAVANKIPNLLSIGQTIMIMAWQENASIASADKDADKYYSKILRKVFDLMFGFTVLLIAATPIIFKLLIRGDYREAYYQMPVLILAMFFYVMSSFFGGIYIAYKKTANVGISTMVAAMINLFIDIAFVRVIGIWAGSVSTLAAYFFLYIYRMLNCQKFQQISIDYGKQLFLILLMIAMLCICFINNNFLNIINIVVGIILFCLFNRNVVIDFLSLTVKKLKWKQIVS